MARQEPVEFPSGYDVYHWPEFYAFAKRLGIEWTLPTTNLIIEIPVHEPVKITHEYRGQDITQEADAANTD